MHCPISLIPLSELEHPVVFRNQSVPVVYDAEHLITWLQTSRRNPTTNEVLTPFTPLNKLLLPYRLQHTTDAQFAHTRLLLINEKSSAKEVQFYGHSLWANIIIPMLDVALTPLIISLAVMLAVVVVTVLPEVALRLLELNRLTCPEQHCTFSILEELISLIAQTYSSVMLGVNLIYITFVHPITTTVIHVYFASDCVTRWWCEGLAMLKNSPLLGSNTTVHRVTGLDVLLGACRCN
jgi:hypothetical protein